MEKGDYESWMLVDEKQLSELYGFNVKTLRWWRYKHPNDSLPYHKVVGKVLYNLGDVASYLASVRLGAQIKEDKGEDELLEDEVNRSKIHSKWLRKRV